MTMSLTADQIMRYPSDGFLVVAGVLPAADIAELCGVTDSRLCGRLDEAKSHGGLAI
jgi:hypothetical protein